MARILLGGTLGLCEAAPVGHFTLAEQEGEAMIRCLFKGLVVLGCVALLATPVLSGPSAVSCAAVGVQTSPDTVTAGNGVGIYGSISNCTDVRKRYTVAVSAMSDCGQKAGITSFRLAFKPNENRMYGVSYTTPPDTCAGPMTLTVDVLDGDRVLASASTTVTMLN